MTKPFAEQIDEIMERFKWKRMARIMRDEQWCWGNADESPTVAELQLAARRMLEAVAVQEPLERFTLIEQGGLLALRWDGVLSLYFAACGWDGK